jgi:DeoR/GlpR family transcriptional regulator of sugar metabolism
MQAEKEAIAAAAAELAKRGTAIGLSAGTTTYALALRLVEVPGLTVVTNSIPVADVLHSRGRADQTVILTGGVRTPSDALVGPLAVASIRSVHVDVVFMGVHGMYPRGFTTPNILEAETNRALVEAGQRLIVLADHSKWGVVGISAIARLDEADTLITDTGLDPSARTELATALKLVMVEPAAARDGRARVAAAPARR